MSISLLSVLKMIPWGEVIKKAPEIADGARKLWQAVARKPPAAEIPTAGSHPPLATQEQSLVMLQNQLAAAEAEISDLHNQMLESTELIKALADQNTQLIKRVELDRIKVRWLTAIVAVLGIVTVINLAVALTR